MMIQYLMVKLMSSRILVRDIIFINMEHTKGQDWDRCKYNWQKGKEKVKNKSSVKFNESNSWNVKV